MTTWLAIAALWFCWYAFCCVWWPFKDCPIPHCEKGKVKSPKRKAFRRCKWCRGKGYRVRWGRRIADALLGLQKTE
ncbi:hypothetical protein LQ327_09165 [Actinomycetospora endophytica]|uniref:Uncharacterized protein n=1 Tax=Actinomycetospora endophytica TaxID=2291215 RepID=A0ABS8P6I6_9PSEU|nr:hypothetical protein [Actinomycetospora endophytica]MCD2193552.1 hypothetical protein [Actinomycetospora endophytica]